MTPNKTLEPTRVGALGSAVADYIFLSRVAQLGRSADSHTMTKPTTKMTVDLASPPDREKLVAQISFDREQWAEVHQEAGALTLELYPRQDGKPWEFPFDEAVAALGQAYRRLIGNDSH